MPKPEIGQDEARRKLADKIADIIRDKTHVYCGCLFGVDKAADAVLTALRAEPVRAAEEMRDRCAKLVEKDRRSDIAKEQGYFPLWQGYALELAAAIRALPADDGSGADR